ncbi:GTPase domain-containing protein [Cryobacterium sp. Hz9]|uniref:GTPase domain-containing protein n=1 Tax=Cryobacterium sp. Hz9 TaxID=1259167 RepID=UPI00106D4082|nr:GTPase domain-containing protein [Cryobacterium sp. Hz9]TFB66162.1 hypothetical protein E3N85_09970 [Cryobacterium sp. Hz9]
MVIAIVALVAAAGGIAAVLTRFGKRVAGQRVAILGSQKVGKTSLLYFLREGKVPDQTWKTVDPIRGGSFTMGVGGEMVEFAVPKDLPGNDGLGFTVWKEAFSGADYVWYLFRSDLIAQGNSLEIDMVKGHLDMFKDWMDAENSTCPKIILIGTWADKDPGFRKNSGKFRQIVGSASPIKIGSVKLNNAGLVVGGLITNMDASALVKSLGARL